ncbi:ABC transporter permease [Arhodomonas sp. SL1]|uniref:ABC transporter permease n=1 Tax=Arhodomonas sp. SL1 TaxID=3425691 RepID=UPI003F885639
MRWLLLAGRRALFRERLQLALALTGIALGVAVVVAVDLANRGAREAMAEAVTRVAGASTHQLVGVSTDLPEALYRRLRVELGIAAAMPVLEGRVSHGGRGYELLGLDPLVSGPFRTGVELSADGGLPASLLVRGDRVAVSAATARELGVGRGDRLALDTPTGTESVEVAAVLDDPQRRLDGVLVTDIAAAQELLGRVGELGRIELILADDEASQVRALLAADQQLLPAGRRQAALAGMSDAFHINLRALSLLALVVGLFLVLNTMSFLVVRRRAMLATLRAVGASRGQVVVQVLADAALLAVAGTLIGLPLGAVLGTGLSSLVAATVDQLYLSIGAVDPWQPLALVTGALLGLAGPLAAALPAAVEAASVPPRAGLARADLEVRARRTARRMAAGGLGLLVAGALLISISDGLAGGFAGLFAVILGAALLAPLWVRWLAAAGRGGGLGWRLAVRGAAASLSRTGIAVAALSVAVATVIGVATMIASFRASVVDWLEASLRSDLYLSASEGLPEGLAGRLRARPEVARVAPSHYRELPVEDGDLPLRAVAVSEQDRGAYPLVESLDGAWRAFDTESVVLVSEPLAARKGLTPGDTLTLPAAEGPAHLEVAGVYRDYAEVRGNVLMRLALYRRLWDDRRTTGIGVVAAPDVEASALGETLRGELPAHVSVTDNRQVYRRSLAVFDQTFRVTEVLRALAAVVAFVGVLGALMALQLERAREVAVMRALGLTRRGVAVQVFGQSGFLGAAAGLWAMPLGLVLAWLLVAVINQRAFGWSLDFRIAPEALLQGLALAVVAALLAAAWPARRLALAQPARGLRLE